MWKVAVVTKQVTKTGALQPASIVSVFSLYNSANGRAPFSTTKFPGVDLPENVPEPALSSAQAQFRQGTGGRSSFTGNVITVFGATGFLGPIVVNRLARSGNQLIIPYRCDSTYFWVRELKVAGDLGQILFFPFQLKDEESIRKAVKYSNVVINCIGTKTRTKNYSLHETNVEGARRLARISREMGVQKFIHVSALNADVNHQPKFFKKAQFLKTKGLGELAVREEFPDATIVRPAVIYGEMDYFISSIISRHRKTPFFHWLWLYKRGLDTYKMPVFVGDVAKAISLMVTDPTAKGKTYELPGPHCYQLRELVEYMYAKARCTKDWSMEIIYVRWNPYYTVTLGWSEYVIQGLIKKFYYNNYEWVEVQEATSDVLSNDVLGFTDLGINKLTEFEYVGGKLCFFLSPIYYFMFVYKESEEPPLPLRVPPLRKPVPKEFGLLEESTPSTTSRPFSFIFNK